MRVSSLRVFVGDLEGCAEFFGTKLGLTLKVDGRQHGWLVFDDAAGLSLVVEGVAPDAPAEDRSMVGRFTGISFAVDDIDAEHARLAAAGVPFDGMPERQAWGGSLATLRDPAGNQFQLVSYPKPSA
jgi:lactoylglutathione lyase